MKAIRKAIIPCGGLGTRFLPVTKAVPKEILPVIDTPVLGYIVDELTDSGIDEIYIILAPGKEAIKEYFTDSARLEKALSKKPEMLELVRGIGKKAEIRFGVQDNPRGSGDAVMRAREFTGGDAFCMCNGDDLIVSDVPAAKQLIDAYAKTPALIVGVQNVPVSETSKYGIINPTRTDGKTVWCNGIVEKPKSDPPSRLAALGRYILTPEIYERIERTPEVNGEVGLTDAICDMMRDGLVYAYEFDGRRYDMGDKFGALTATVEFALKRPEFGDKFRAFLKTVINNDN
ncbi:MAG: UTP--glucose-1-phosphate uridylyltransferase [Clostridia bacterium]|nr:UTP--glucose-1-phosphate uridylyltransferase [Clostridia bacterium]